MLYNNRISYEVLVLLPSNEFSATKQLILPWAPVLSPPCSGRRSGRPVGPPSRACAEAVWGACLRTWPALSAFGGFRSRPVSGAPSQACWVPGEAGATGQRAQAHTPCSLLAGPFRAPSREGPTWLQEPEA